MLAGLGVTAYKQAEGVLNGIHATKNGLYRLFTQWPSTTFNQLYDSFAYAIKNIKLSEIPRNVLPNLYNLAAKLGQPNSN